MTKGEINRLGESIRENNLTPSDSLLESLEAYRVSHKQPLAKVFKELCRIKYRVGRNTIVTYRIKRFQSIINKLHRFRDMKFSRMWDIGGCRCIVENDEGVYKLKEEIEKIFEIKKTTDYIKNPKNNGYRSLHLYISVPDSKVTVEIQIRSQRDHNWATLVEISDLLFDSGLKEYGKQKDLLKFHLLLAKREKLSNAERKEIIKISRNNRYIEKLGEVFVRNHLSVRKKWFEIEINSKLRYFLIKASSETVPEIKAYENFDAAESAYFENFRQNPKSNVVLTHLLKPKFEQISVAYSNYILTKHSFLDESAKILEALILSAIDNQSVFEFYRYFNYYQNIIFSRLSDSIKEVVYMKNIEIKKEKKIERQLKKKEKEWKEFIEADLKEFDRKVRTFKKEFNRHFPKSNFSRTVFRFLIRLVFKRHNKKFDKLKKSLSKPNIIY